MPNKNFLCEYIQDYQQKELKTAQNLTKGGYKAYMYSLTLFLEYTSEKLKKPSYKIPSSEIEFRLIYDFMVDMSNRRSWKATTWNVRLSGIKAFIRYLSLQDPWFLETYNRVRLIKSKRVTRKDPDYIKKDDVNLVLRNAGKNSWINLRDHVIVQFIMATGLRVTEVCSLRVTDLFQVNARRFDIRFVGKGKKRRVFPLIDTKVIANLNRYLSISHTSSIFVFPSRNGTRMSESNLRKRISLMFRSFDLLEKVTPHTLRRSAAMHWYRSGMSIYDISDALGHERVKTTFRYVKASLDDRLRVLKQIGDGEISYEPFIMDQKKDTFLEGLKRSVRKSDYIGHDFED